MIQGEWVSKRKHWEHSVKSHPKKKAWVEVELESESEGRRTGWRAWGLQDLSFAMLGLQESEDEQNELLREQNGFLQRIAMCLERMGVERERGPELDSILRE